MRSVRFLATSSFVSTVAPSSSAVETNSGYEAFASGRGSSRVFSALAPVARRRLVCPPAVRALGLRSGQGPCATRAKVRDIRDAATPACRRRTRAAACRMAPLGPNEVRDTQRAGGLGLGTMGWWLAQGVWDPLPIRGVSRFRRRRRHRRRPSRCADQRVDGHRRLRGPAPGRFCLGVWTTELFARDFCEGGARILGGVLRVQEAVVPCPYKEMSVHCRGGLRTTALRWDGARLISATKTLRCNLARLDPARNCAPKPQLNTP